MFDIVRHKLFLHTYSIENQYYANYCTRLISSSTFLPLNLHVLFRCDNMRSTFMFHYFAVQSHNIEHPCQQFHRLSAVHFCNLSFYHDVALSIILAHFTVIVDHVEYLSSYLLIYIFVLSIRFKICKKKKKNGPHCCFTPSGQHAPLS